jgi:uncharacterized protein (TIGR00297 family)
MIAILPRAATAILSGIVVAHVARRAGALSAGGAGAAAAVGAAAVAAGWPWAGLLLLYFASSSALSKVGSQTKDERAGSVVTKTGARDAMQVLANGGVFALAALAFAIAPGVPVVAFGLGALASSAADTWATEIGTLFGGEPRSILTARCVPVGTSGGVTIAGTTAALGGALFIGLGAWTLGWNPRLAFAAAIGGFVGALVDSLIGAGGQTRRWCDHCNASTEQTIHRCGATTRHAGGIAWLDNDGVNFVAGVVGGLFAVVMAG